MGGAKKNDRNRLRKETLRRITYARRKTKDHYLERQKCPILTRKVPHKRILQDKTPCNLIISADSISHNQCPSSPLLGV